MRFMFNKKSFEDPSRFRGFLTAVLAAVSAFCLWFFGEELDPEVTELALSVGVPAFTLFTAWFIRTGKNGSVAPATMETRLENERKYATLVAGDEARKDLIQELEQVNESRSRRATEAYMEWLNRTSEVVSGS